MPPAAALECDRTGWTLDMIATVAPASAAASAARWPASPAPMIRTSWEGIARHLIRRGGAGGRAPVHVARRSGPADRDGRGGLVQRGGAGEVADRRGGGC